MENATFSDLSDKERAWIQGQLDALPLFVEAYSPGDKDQPVTLDVLDRAFDSWLSQRVKDEMQINGAINIVGIRFGQFLVDEAGFRWVIATDKRSSELAILALPGRGEVLAYPANFVAKRWERGESNFLVAAFDAVREQVQRIQAANKKRRQRWWKFW
jgi:Domain of unknown function (DUF3806)